MLNFLNFMRESVSCFHAANNISSILLKNGFKQLEENNYWQLEYGHKYFIKRNDSAIVAFKIPAKKTLHGLNITSSHLDSPTFKIKPNSLLTDGKYLRLNTEAYGKTILNTWLDRPLSIAGRVLINNNNVVKTNLLYVDKDLLIIPNVAPHLMPNVAKGKEYNLQVDMLPLLGIEGSLDLKSIIAKELKVDPETILDYELVLVNRQRARLGGYNDELVFSPQLDDLACAYTTLMGFINDSDNFNFYVAFDNEEVGSQTRQGASSTYLSLIIDRILEKLNYTIEEKGILLANSFMLSCDNAHALNPNHQEVYDLNNKPYLGNGVVLKYNANQKYTTDALSAAYVNLLAKKAKINLQPYVNRSDIPGGSTLGALLLSQVAIHSADIGLPQLSMHSSLEICASKDLADMINLIKTFYASNLKISDDRDLELI